MLEDNFETLTVWDVAPVRMRWRIQTENRGTRFGVDTLSSDGRFLAALIGDYRSAELRVWDALTGRIMDACVDPAVPQAKEAMRSRMTFSRDSRLLASAYPDGTVRLCDMASGTISTFSSGLDRIAALGFLPEIHKIAVIGSGVLAVWDTRRGIEITHVAHSAFDTNINAAGWSLDGRRVATASRDGGLVHLWDLVATEEIDVLRGHDKEVWQIAFADDGRTLATWGSDDVIKLWDLRTNRELATLPHPDLADLQFTSSGQTLSAIDYRGLLRLYRGATDADVTRVLAQRRHATK